MAVYRLVISGDPRTKKNSQRIVRAGNYMKILPSNQYKEYEKNFLVDCMYQGMWRKKLKNKMNIKCVYYMKTRRKVDLVNLLEATMDCLVASEVIEDDNCSIAYSHDGSCVKYDKERPRVEIEMEEI